MIGITPLILILSGELVSLSQERLVADTPANANYWQFRRADSL